MRSIAFVLLFATASVAAAGEALTEAESLRLGLARAELAELASGALITVSIPLLVFDREQAREHRAAARALAARAEYRLAQAKAEGELRGLHRQIEHLIGAASSYRRQAVAPAAELLQIAETAYQGGESTILELLDAYRGALEAETTALDLEWKARSARIEFDLLTGSNAE